MKNALTILLAVAVGFLAATLWLTRRQTTALLATSDDPEVRDAWLHGNAEAFFFKGSRAEPGIDAPSTEGAPEEQR